MKPTIARALTVCSEELMRIAPLVQPGYQGAVVATISQLMARMAGNWDSAAQLLVEENAALRVLFTQIRPVLQDEAMQRSLDLHIASEDNDLRISALTERNEAMRTLLIEAHAAIELSEEEPARQAVTAIWRELRLSTDRRQCPSDMYG